MSDRKCLSVVLEDCESCSSGGTVIHDGNDDCDVGGEEDDDLKSVMSAAIPIVIESEAEPEADASSSSICSVKGRRRRRTRREGLVASGMSSRVLAVLDTKMVPLPMIGGGSSSSSGSNHSMTVLEAADRASTMGGEPEADLVRTVEHEIRRQGLSLVQKRELFGVMAWRFACLDCGRRQWADQYENASFLLWEGGGGGGDSVSTPPRPRLRSGPCRECKAAAREGKRSGVIVPYRA